MKRVTRGLRSAPLVQNTQKRAGSEVSETATIAPRKTRGERRGTHDFPEKLIVATGTSVLATLNLKGLGAAKTTEPRNRFEHLPKPLLLARLLAPVVGRSSPDLRPP